MKKEMMPQATVEAYIAGFPEAVRSRLEAVRNVIRREVPEALESIKYGIPTYVLNHKNLVHFGGYSRHVGFYPSPAAIRHFKPDLAGFATSKGTVQFPLDQPMPLELIARMTRYRVEDAGF